MVAESCSFAGLGDVGDRRSPFRFRRRFTSDGWEYPQEMQTSINDEPFPGFSTQALVLHCGQLPSFIATASRMGGDRRLSRR